jgi:hypothetical protein
MAASERIDWPEWVDCTRSPAKKAAVRLPDFANVS